MPEPAAPAPTVQLSTGRIRGVDSGGIRRFLGIPYAKPPFGARRFAAPVPVEPWSDIRPAEAFGPTAPQAPYAGRTGTLLSTVTIPGEDILTVNVWAPEGAHDAPVFVWVHGGALERGTAALPGYDGSAFARDGVVFVSVNYRLGSEGFSGLAGVPANLGLRDVALALEWVQREVGAFGGSPDRITIAGESAGGALVAALIAQPASRSRVAGAIVQSGPLEALSTERAARAARAVARRLDVPPTRDGLTSVSPEDLVAARVAETAGASLLSRVPAFALSLDPESLPVQPEQALRDADIPLLIGTNTEEYRLWLAPDALKRIGRLKSALARRALRLPMAAVRAARREWPEASPGELLGQLLTDALLRAPATRAATARPAPTWFYEFAWRSPVPGIGAAHALELGFVFDQLSSDEAKAMAGDAPPPALADEMHAAWVRFTKVGDPGWDGYAQDRSVRVFDTVSATRTQPRAAIVDAMPARR